MVSVMVPPGLQTKFNRAWVNLVAICWISIICVSIWHLPVSFVPQRTPRFGSLQQKQRLKRNHVAAVLRSLHPFLELGSVPDKTAPVRAAYRYITNRLQQLDYKGAIAAELPIGSGEIESAHRYVIQQRLKRSGSWWSVENAWAMLALRVLRANQDWQSYWLALAQNAA